MASDGGQDRITVSIDHPDGIKLPFTESLVRFLVNRRDKRRPFFLGHWLAALDGAELGRLVSLAEDITLNLAAGVEGASEGEGGDDLMGVLLHALAAETGKMGFDPEDYPAQMGGLYFMGSLEEARRAGWIVLEGALSLAEPSRGVATITDKGFKEMPETFRNAMH